MQTDVRLRSASPSDWPQIAALLDQCSLHSDDPLPSVESFHVALCDVRIVGCAAAERHGTSIVIRSVAVDPAYRDRGVASRLVEALLMHARGTEVRHALLLSASAPAYFARWGFSHIPVDEAPAEVQGSAEFRNAVQTSALCMHCDLR
ncbi:GNAT family N-acetyltransferase [Cupriavidus necator]|uniref:GNAT family N-acetyltransferase n=1 Tax=Cupriavidus necator TaxID=106590 RepID=UPI0012D2E471|nr:GNAT family N-acetyltransferase [Cupriavidus necator]